MAPLIMGIVGKRKGYKQGKWDSCGEPILG